MVNEQSGSYRICNLWIGSTTVWEQINSLDPGDYLCRIQAFDNVGRASLYSEWGRVKVLPLNSIGWIKTISPGVELSLSKKIVTARFADCIYIEEPDYSAALRINGSFQVNIGDEVNVSGNTSLTDVGEICMSNANVTVISTGSNIRPLLIPQRNIGYGIPSSDRPYIGPDVTSMLMKVYGRVTNLLPDGFYLDDMSLLPTPSGSFGIKITTSDLPPGSFTAPAVGDFALASGIVGRYKSEGKVYPFIRCRIPSDISIYH